MTQDVQAVLKRRLRPGATTPLAVGFSGGGDSLALLRLTLDWAASRGRPVLALTVDHGLNPASAGWTADAVAKARALGAQAQALHWIGDKPSTGVQAAARAARHALLANAARQAGARVLLLGHTADDRLEAARMRGEGSTTSDPRQWAPSPAWPDGRGVFVLRPLLEARRQALRDWLSERGETWLEDPANADARFARARARAALSGEHPVIPPLSPDPVPPAAIEGEHALRLPRDASAAQVAAACLCAAGTVTPPRGERLERLVARLRSGETFVATLAGARIMADAAGALFVREAGEGGRSGLSPLVLAAGETGVWDGRYEITTPSASTTIRPLGGLASRLPADESQALKGFPAAVRPVLPAAVDAVGMVSSPILAGAGTIGARVLIRERFEAATGLIDQEPAT
ncbi:tRNA lysidine(34) synthetase TilS [Caulobacter radicis]|uniref:tRNA lysidine(34) synthetase TilS n=1 Tax=Caulobacter radicis TaxID=2172650 RepID=UPI000D580E28|nr:tRNA lysidine(34) synthetase TilS [Caulobacter radicis]PVM86392.1 tRNA lysidine(34) synthetase TilS [Caulobacter radicis]